MKEQIFNVFIFFFSFKIPSWPTIIKYAVVPRLLLVTWCLALKNARESGKMANEKGRKWNFLESHNWILV